MVLTRSDSSQSARAVPATSDGEDEIRDQHRIRNLCAVLVRNLSLDPAIDEATSGLTPSIRHRPLSLDLGSPTSSLRPPLPTRETWTEGVFSEASTSKGKEVRRHGAGSDASWTGGLGENDVAEGQKEEREIVLDSGGKRPFVGRTRPSRSSSAATLLTRPSTTRIEEEDPVASAETGPSTSTSTSTSTRLNSASFTRPRSSSRLSNGSIQSASTVRQAPRLPTTQQQPERRPPTTSSQFAQKDKRRREEALRRRLLDSFVSLELIPPEADGADGKSEDERKKSGSVMGIPWPVSSSRMRRSGSGGSVRSMAAVSDASFSPRKSMRRRTQSSSFLPTSAASASNLSLLSSPPRPPAKPFYVSSPCPSSMHPTFPIDREHFTFPPSSSSFSMPSTSPSFTNLDDLQRIDHWTGLRQSRVKAKVFVRQQRSQYEAEETKEKGKGKAQDHGPGGEAGDAGWTCLIEWEVALDGLTSLGRDPTTFPALPPNTLIFALSPTTSFSPAFSTSSSSTSTDLEYFTAPLPLLHKALRRALRAGRSVTRRETLREAVSEDELSEEDSCSTCDEDENDGNLSDPGVSATAATSGGRPRSGTLTLRTRRDNRRRLLAERLRVEEERRRRKEVVEKSRRETRMVRAADELEVQGLWEGEREAEKLRAECARLKEQVRKGLEETGADLEREDAELHDRIDDLEAVKLAEKEELVEDEAALEKRRVELQARRARLEAAKVLDEDNSQQLEQWRGELDADDRAFAKLAASAQSRRTYLITLVSSIFPIEPVFQSASSPSPPPLLFTICSIPLPNSSFPPPYDDDDLLSSALGYAAQLTQMLAAYLGVPLCYPIKCCGSRSTITDEISMMKGPRAFPLYGKGVDSYRFDYGVFLLNKNIEQLMYSQSLTVLDLRNTLPNLKTLLLSLSYESSHPDYRAATLLPVAPFLPSSDGQGPSSSSVAAMGDPRSRSPSPAGSSDDSAAGSSASGTADSTPASSTGSLPPLEATSNSSSGFRTRTSRSSSLASTIRARSTSPTRTVRADDGGQVATSGLGSERTGSPSPSLRSNGAAGGDDDGQPGDTPVTAAEKALPPPRSPSPSSAALPSAVPVKLKQRSRVRSSSGSSTTSGYGKRFADGLWNAVAGRPAMEGGARR
ncbi:hypothetical protein JCM11251_003350 [Rhodosporidiobolus azoricus]